jgi:hypothetical protein
VEGKGVVLHICLRDNLDIVTFDEMASGGEIRSIILYLYNRIRVSK